MISALPFTDTVNTEWATEEVSDPEPDNVGFIPFASVWYAFTPAATGRYVFDARTSDFDADIIAVCTGSCGALTIIAETDDGVVSVDFTASTTYRILFGTWDAGGGNLSVEVREASPYDAPVMSVVTLNSTVAVLSWTATGPAFTPYQVERCAGAGCTSWVEVDSTTATTRTYGGLIEGTLYRFRGTGK